MFRPAPGRALNIDPERRLQSQNEFAKVAADPTAAPMFQSLSLAAVAELTAEHGDRLAGPLVGLTLGFQAPVLQGAWSLNFERDVGASPNTPLAGPYVLLSFGYRFSPASDATGSTPPARRIAAQ